MLSRTRPQSTNIITNINALRLHSILERLQSEDAGNLAGVEEIAIGNSGYLCNPIVIPRRSNLTSSILSLDGITVAVITIIAIACFVRGE